MNPLLNDEATNETTANTPARFQIPIPGLTSSHAAGDLVQSMTKAFGISADECSPCQQRKKQLNSFLAFVPYDNDASGSGGLG